MSFNQTQFERRSDKMSRMGGKRTPDKIAAGKRLEFLRAELDIPAANKESMRAFAAYLKVDEARYGKWANGENRIPDFVAQFFLERHNIPSDWLKHNNEKHIPAWLYIALHRAA